MQDIGGVAVITENEVGDEHYTDFANFLQFSPSPFDRMKHQYDGAERETFLDKHIFCSCFRILGEVLKKIKIFQFSWKISFFNFILNKYILLLT